MELTSEVIYNTNRNLTLNQVRNFNRDIREFEDVEKGELQLFLAHFWKKYEELEEKYENLCDKIEYEEGWDPREED